MFKAILKKIRLFNFCRGIKRFFKSRDKAYINGFCFDVNSLSFWYDFNRSDRWEPATRFFYRKYTHPNKAIIDIGAWIGPTVFLGYANNAKKIYAVEADPINYSVLKANCHHNLLLDKVHLINNCVYKVSDQVIYFGTPLTSDNSSTKSFTSADKGYKVLTKTLVDLIKENHIDDFNIVKIDIEGSEIYLTDDLVYLSKIKGLHILFSLHPCFWENNEQALTDLKGALLLYKIYDAWGRNLLSYDEVVAKASQCDIFELILETKD